MQARILAGHAALELVVAIDGRAHRREDQRRRQVEDGDTQGDQRADQPRSW
jgi:hypothetical protein